MISKYTYEESKKFHNPLRCYDCGLQYNSPGWCDIVIPNDVWELISPVTVSGGGILCFNCISNRLASLDLKDIPIKITSGPYQQNVSTCSISDPDKWICHKCAQKQSITINYMILCPICGNKRCPKASDCSLSCTNSNEINSYYLNR